MEQTRVEVLKEVFIDKEDGWKLCFQYCAYNYGNEEPVENNFRFIYRRPDGSLQGARGQAGIKSLTDITTLLRKAGEDGWHRLNDIAGEETVRQIIKISIDAMLDNIEVPFEVCLREIKEIIEEALEK